MSRTVAVVLCAGAGTRTNHSMNKVYLHVGGRPIAERAVRPFHDHPGIDEVYVVAAPREIDFCADLLATSGADVLRVIPGGATRHGSERNAVELLAPRIESGDIDIVMIHDGARPLFDGAKLDELIEVARRSGGAMFAVPLKNDLMVTSADGVVGRLPRDGMWRAFTPQAFRADLLLEAFRTAARDGFEGTDTAATVERIGGKVGIVRGDVRNLKVTFPEDFIIAERLAELDARERYP